MDRREFFQSIALTTAVTQALAAAEQPDPPDTTGHTLQCEFSHNNTNWKVYEDLSTRDGSITFVPARGAARVMGKRLEAVFSQAAVPFLGLSREEIGASLPDLLADKLLAGGGDPDEIQVRDAAPLIGGPLPPSPPRRQCSRRRRHQPVEYVCRHQRVLRHRSRVCRRQHAHVSPQPVFRRTAGRRRQRRPRQHARALGRPAGRLDACRPQDFSHQRPVLYRRAGLRRRGGARQVHRADVAPHRAHR